MLRESNLGITGWPRGPLPHNRNSGQVSILLDKNRKEGTCPPLSLAQQDNPLCPKKSQSNTEIMAKKAESWGTGVVVVVVLSLITKKKAIIFGKRDGTWLLP